MLNLLQMEDRSVGLEWSMHGSKLAAPCGTRKGIMARRRGLIRSAMRTAGRTAVIAGTATAVSGRVANRQREANARRREAESAQATPDAFHGPAANGQDLVSRLHQLADLKAMGALTDKEFTAAKTRLLQE